MNILLAGAIAALFIAFIFVLMKLNPTTENKQSQEQRTNIDKEKPQLLQSPQPPRTLPPSLKSAESSISGSKPTVQTTQAPKAPLVDNQAKQSFPPPTPVRIETREIPKQNKTAPTPVKPELTPTRKDCIHFYGYLHSLPKNTPIPDECFGCVKIVDCLINPNSSNSSSNSNSNRNSKKRGWL
jgi:hypothetical protein